MTTLTATTPTRKPSKPYLGRFARLGREAAGDFLVIRQVFARKPDSFDLYRVEAFLSEMGGHGVELVKPDGTVYHVLVNGPASTCDCKGHLQHGHCKHVESLLALESLQPSACAVEQPLDEAEKPFAGCHKCAGRGYLTDQHRATVCRCSCWGF